MQGATLREDTVNGGAMTADRATATVGAGLRPEPLRVGTLTLQRYALDGGEPSDPVARVAILHGYGDHAGRFAHVMRWLAGWGIASHAIDFRGHGRSEGRRGFVNRWDEFLDDLSAFLASPPLSRPGPPVFVLGHSHGGLVAAAAGARGVLRGVAGVVLTSPYLDSLVPVAPLKLLFGRCANAVVPWLRVRSGLNDDMMSADPAMLADSRADPLLLRSATPRWYLSALKVQAQVRSEANLFRHPLLALAGSADVIAAPAATQRFVEQASSADKTYRSFPDLKHELLREATREDVLHVVGEWLTSRAQARRLPE